MIAQDIRKTFGRRALYVGDSESGCCRVPATAEVTGQLRQVDFAIRAAAQTYAETPQIEQRDHGLSLSLVQFGRHFTAVADAARGAYSKSIAQRSLDHGVMGDL
jgi:hypothetical protein